MSTPPDPDPGELARRVVAHFRSVRRELPWRRTRDPYAIWVSEVMLQQTRVAAVIPYYERWMARFPDVRALAAAPPDEVLAAWSGLGYYSRARNLHRGARQVAAGGGRLPEDAAALRRIPGIGRYTAGAIASIAFGRREPVVDGNVARVLARVYAIEGDVRAAAAQTRLWQAAGRLVPARAPGDFNQGLMELGATVCTPGQPACPACPLAPMCRARAAGRERELPHRPRRRRAHELPLIDAAALWIERRGRVLLARRPPHGLFGGLWELPQAQVGGEAGAAGEAGRELAARAAAAVPARVREVSAAPVHELAQVLTHRRLRIRVFTARLDGRLGKPDGQRYDSVAWHLPARPDERGLSAATQHIIDRFLEHDGWNQTRPRFDCSPRDSRRSSTGSTRSAIRPGPTRTSTTRRGGRQEGSTSS